jgi:hypothetical protein
MILILGSLNVMGKRIFMLYKKKLIEAALKGQTKQFFKYISNVVIKTYLVGMFKNTF